MDPSNDIDNLLKTSQIIKDINQTLIDLKMQHNAMVKTSSRKDTVSDKIPGYSLFDSAWKKLYYSKIVNNKDDYKVKLFDIPVAEGNTVADGNNKGGGGGQIAP